MDYLVVEVKEGKFACDTLVLEVKDGTIQVPVLKEVKATQELVEKHVYIDDLYAVPLKELEIV